MKAANPGNRSLVSSESTVEWINGVTTDLGLEGATDTEQSLGSVDELARQLGRHLDAEAVHRTLFLVGIAAGRAEDPSVAAQDMAQKLGAMAEGWNSDAERGVPSNDQSRRG